MNIYSRITESVIKTFRESIQEASGNEVFATGNINEDGILNTISIHARGNENSVPLHLESLNHSVLLHNHPSGVLYPSQADMSIAAHCGENGQGFYIVNNDVTNLYVVVEPIKPKKIEKLDQFEVVSYLSFGGPLEKISPYFEERSSQLELVKSVCKSLNENLIGVFEAGTGVGKSYAYLIPAILWTIKNKERIVISTGTINLQQQLYEKDIPNAEKVTGKKIKTVLIKGRQNYVCLRRLRDTMNEKDLFSEETEELDKIYKWAQESGTGSKSDLSFMPTESLWQKINSESDACKGMRCAHRENCFVMKTRKEAADAQILIVNHHLLFADIEMRLMGVGYDDTAVLPSFKRLILDEAHGIEGAATSFFSETVTRFKIFKQLNLIYRTRRGATAGLLFTLEALSSETSNIQEIYSLIESIRTHMEELEQVALTLLGNNYTWRLCQQTAPLSSDLLVAMKKLREDLSKFTSVVRVVLDGISEEDSAMDQVWETKQVLRRIDAASNLCQNFLSWDEKPETVFWIERNKLTGTDTNIWYPKFIQTPLDIAPMMNSGVYEPLDSVVCTSATIQVAHDCNFWKKRTGVLFQDGDRVLEGSFSSPFPYKKNVLFAIPTDAPLPSESLFQPWIEEAIVMLVRASQGKTLVLFTAYDSLRSACDYARPQLAKEGIQLLKQGDDDRFRLLESFKNNTSSVLFATHSFWEGVDVPGDSLSQVIIVKLPFSVPNDPVFAARSEDLEKKGKSSFMELSVPEAVIKFRQGFGRLMRRSSDKGVVVVLDNRIIKKQYGALFLQSIPETKTLFSQLRDITKNITEFI
jgi:ATP-dependent DNA helicase DinG